ncbi:hypothetical protein A7K69_11750 [Parageobacillus thermoglucosidasius]|jgi:hypothetical protein|uniref:Uncharacterized protein n=1 Tax=Parageobacillus thermoglucosidasius TaxID=1426 RepID=A0A1B7KPQ5_PARTM|nr:hypothetical protein A7K69_11750 [Parageobacillus thermoglucosidasius]
MEFRVFSPHTTVLLQQWCLSQTPHFEWMIHLALFLIPFSLFIMPAEKECMQKKEIDNFWKVPAALIK